MDRLIGWLLGLPRTGKQMLVFVLDALIVVWSVYAAFYLRLGRWVDLDDSRLWAVVVALLLAMPLFIAGGFYRAIFRHVGLSSMLLIVRTALIYGTLYSLVFTFWSVPEVPRTLGLIQPILLFVVIGATRAFAHYLLGRRYRRSDMVDKSPAVVIYGAGDTGRLLARSLRISRELRVVGFIDDDPSLHNGRVDGLAILARDRLDELIARHEVTEVLLALPSTTRARRREIVDWLSARPVAVRSVPALNDLASGKVSASEIRPVAIEDLLGRQPVMPDWDLLRRPIFGKCVLVTGAGGSIGSELARQIMALRPHTLVLLDASEHALYEIDRELRRTAVAQDVAIMAIMATVRDRQRLDAVFGRYRPDTVFHAAAYKHVPLVEANFIEGIRNNFLGTKNIGELSVLHGVKDAVLISTDKAVRPTNLMGASKRLAELAFQMLGEGSTATRLSAVRFGNVLNSAGSVVPLFKEQIERGGPITITHPEVTRYFMTIPEAAQLVLQAAAMSKGGGETFLLDMGNPVKILDLAKLMIQLSNLSLLDRDNASGDIEIEFVGLRPGEKLYEELLIGNESQPTDHPRIFQAHEPIEGDVDLADSLADLERVLAGPDPDRVLRLVDRLVQGYQGGGAIADAELGSHAAGRAE